MSDFSLTLVLHFKTSKNFNGMQRYKLNLRKSLLLEEYFM